MTDLLDVKVSNFEGPLDLLLHLIYKNELDIYDIPISLIADQFVEEVRKLEDIDIEVAADFIQMASYLIYLKSKMLLPQQIAIEEGIDPEEERFIFAQRLIEYSFYKDVAVLLKEKEFFAQRNLIRESSITLPVTFISDDPYKLAKSFFSLMEEGEEEIKTVVKDTIDLSEVVKYLEALFQKEKNILWDRLLSIASSKREAVVFFLAVLELVKQKVVDVLQGSNFDNFMVVCNG
ncbi:MAG: segregation/condensation protein A [Calditerrivibrio sp.]|nr:segregation/condensation protein A [Calditerrivibrio sp.]